jgi:hypothetical protein
MSHFRRSTLVVTIFVTPFSFWLAHLQYGGAQPLTQTMEAVTLMCGMLQVVDLLYEVD